MKLHLNRGNDNGVAIRYGVNLSDIKQDYDASGSYNAVAPYWKSEDGTLVTLTEGYITASSVQTGDEIIPVPLDLSSEFENQPTEAQLRTEARRQLDNSEAWVPDENISVKFIDLAHTQEYKDIAALQRVRLCDKVSVYCGPLGVNAVKMQVIKTVYNVLLEEYDEIELGTAKTSFADTIMAKISDVTGDLPTTTEVKSMLRQAVGEATDQITGAQNSHVRFIYDANDSLQEIVILDTDDITTATKVWRWNRGGLGYSSNGYAGPYTLAMTQNGAIVADFINTGTLTANLIRAGVLQDVNGNNVWNLATGEFRLASTTTVGGSTVAAIAQDKVDDLDDALTQQAIFNRLTNNGATQGIYLKNGLLYINATYIDTGELSATLIKGGILKLGGASNVNGALQILNANGSVIGSWDKDGINASSGSFSGAINGGTIDIRLNDDYGFSVGPYGDIAVGTKPPSLSSFEYNSCPFQVNNSGAVKMSELFFYGLYGTSTTTRIKFGSIIAAQELVGSSYIPGIAIRSNVDSWIAFLSNIGVDIRKPVSVNSTLTVSGTTTFSADITQRAKTIYSYLVSGSSYAAAGNIQGSNTDNYYEVGTGLRFNSPDGACKLYISNAGLKMWTGVEVATSLTVHSTAQFKGSLTVNGTKSRVVTTDQYSNRLLYCYETPSPMFGDIGEGVVGEDGKCFIWLDPVFVQTISTDQYQVFLQRYGEGDIYVSERRGGCFVVTGTPGMAFGWEVKAKQKDFDQRRLDNPEELVTVITSHDYGVEAAQHISAIQEGRRE